MENIKIEITEQYIKDYLEKYKNYYKNCGPLFVKYLKDNRNNFTEEMFEILTKGKIDLDNKDELTSFNPMPSTIENLDLSGICHILIPTMKYYGNNIITVDQLYGNLEYVADELLIKIDHPLDIVESTLNDYEICGKVKTENQTVKIKMNREHCTGELSVYETFYGRTKVKKIRKIIRESK